MKEKKFSGLGMAGVAILLALTVAMSGCSFTGRRGPSSGSSSSTADEDADPGREEVPDDDEPADLPDDSPDDPSDTPDSGSGTSSADESSSAASQAPAASSSSQASGNPPTPSASSAPAASSSAPEKASSAASSASSAASSSASSAAASSPAASRQDKPASSAAGTAGTLKNVTYVQKGAYTKQEKFQNASVRGSGMLIRNKTFYGDMTITNKAGDDGITLQDVDIKGTLTVQGGSDWLKLYGCSVDGLVVDYQGAKVFASQNTSVGSVTVKQDATLQEGKLTGNACGFEDIEVSGKKSETLGLTLKNLDTNKLTTRTDTVVETDKDSRIDIFNARAATRIKGSASIGELTAYEDGVYYDKDNRPNKLYTAGDADRPRPYESSGAKDEDAYDPSKKDVYIEPIDDISIERGEEYTVWVESDARRLTASSSDHSVATVSTGAYEDELIITGKKVGKAKITVKGTRSGYNSDAETFTVEVITNPAEAPVITIQSGDPAAWTNQDVAVSFRVTDTDLYEVKAGGKTWRNSQTNYSFTVQDNGTYGIEAVDAKGNTSKATVNITHIDKAPPQISELKADGLNVSFKLTDSGSGIDPTSVQVQNLDGNARSLTPDGVYCFTGEWGKTYHILAADKAGNVYPNNPENQITLPAAPTPAAPVTPPADDAEPVAVAIISGTDPTGWTSENVTVHFTVKSATPVTNVTITDNIKPEVNGDSYSFKAAENKTYTVTVENGSATPATKDFHVNNIDKEPVTVTVLNAAELEKDENRALEKTVRFSVKAGESMADGNVKVTSVLKSQPVLKNEENGIYSFKVNANITYTIEAKNGASTKETVNIPVNCIGPNEEMIVASVQPPAVGTWAPEKTVTFTVADPVLQLTVSGPKGENVTVAPGTAGSYSFVAAQDGNYTISISYAGKTAFKTVEISHIDAQAPAEPYLYKQDGTKTKCESDVPITTSLREFNVFVPSQEEGQSPITTEYLLDNNGKWEKVPLLPAKQPTFNDQIALPGTDAKQSTLDYQIVLPELPANKQEKTYILKLRARDEAGNSTETTYQITLKAPAAAGNNGAGDAGAGD